MFNLLLTLAALFFNISFVKELPKNTEFNSNVTIGIKRLHNFNENRFTSLEETTRLKNIDEGFSFRQNFVNGVSVL